MRLTEEQRQAVESKLGSDVATGMVPWPEWAPKQYNACTDPCDMWNGPCACGAWHKNGK